MVKKKWIREREDEGKWMRREGRKMAPLCPWPQWRIQGGAQGEHMPQSPKFAASIGRPNSQIKNTLLPEAKPLEPPKVFVCQCCLMLLKQQTCQICTFILASTFLGVSIFILSYRILTKRLFD